MKFFLIRKIYNLKQFIEFVELTPEITIYKYSTNDVKKHNTFGKGKILFNECKISDRLGKIFLRPITDKDVSL